MLRRLLIATLLAAAILSLVTIRSITAFGPATSSHVATGPLPDLVPEVDPFVGTIHGGNIFPGADMPFGMVQWSPDTSAGGLQMPGDYNNADPIIRDFSLTHLSGTGCAAFGNIAFMPTTNPVSVAPIWNESPYSARFDKNQEHASPGSYDVRLNTGIAAHLTVTPRTGFGMFQYPGADGTMLIDVGAGAGKRSNYDGASGGSVKIVGADEVVGSSSGGGFCNLHNRYTVYFAAVFNRRFLRFGTWEHGGTPRDSRVADGPRSGAFLTFDTGADPTVKVRVGLSFVSAQNALLNLQRENAGWHFSAVRRRATQAWNRMLNRVQVTGGPPADRRVFYTALYHSFLHPNVFSDVNGQYLGFDNRVHVARGYTQYANFSGWDIYRSEIPLLAWLAPHETGDMMESLVNDARQSGWLPKWPVANDETGEMDGDSADPILAGAYAFGARGFETSAALKFMIKGATQSGLGRDGYIERPGLREYLRYGYVPPQPPVWGAAAVSLEYATDDFAIGQMAKGLGDKAAYRLFNKRGQNWQNIFNPATGFIEPRFTHGSFSQPFDHSSLGGFVEGNSWQYTWMVPQNVGWLVHRMGGTAVASGRLDRFFTFLNAGWGKPFYWGGNEPGLETPWEYDFMGKPWRTQAVVRRIMTALYRPAADGLPGNDDLGALSSWYVWAAIGLYPEIPGVGGLAIGSPLFPRTTVRFQDGRTLDIVAPAAGRGRPYVQRLRLNGKDYPRTWLPLYLIRGNTTLHFYLRSDPQPKWGSRPAAAPPSF